MNKDVIVTVTGLLSADGEDSGTENIQVISPGEYYEKNGKQLIVYEEIVEDCPEPIRNMLKISPDQVSIRKRGIINSEMVFDRKTNTISDYSTPYGSMVMGIRTRNIKVQEEEHQIQIRIDYELEINYEHASDCSIEILIQSKGVGTFSLA